MVNEKEILMPHWGKYKGQNIKQVPVKYLLWLYNDWGMKNSGELHREVREYIEKNIISNNKK